MIYQYEGENYLLNLIDTPGHVDFNYEVSRSMKACEGALLLVDAVKGVQAQTLANWWLAVQNNLEIVPIINKIDLVSAQPQVIAQQLASTFGMDPEKVIKISALSGYGVENIFPAIVKLIPSPNALSSRPFRALLFDSWYADVHAGVMCLIKIAEGSLKLGDKIQAGSTRQNYEVLEVGIMHPEPISTDCLFAGQVGYVKLGMKTTKEARVGDTFYHAQKDNSVPVELFSGFKPAKAMVFAGIYPEENGEFDALRDAIEKLTLNDPSVTADRDHNDVLGMGYRCGFLGLLHMDVFLQRLREEYNTTVIATAPNIPVRFKMLDGSVIEITTASKFPANTSYTESYEPFVKATIFTPSEFVGQIIQLCFDRRGEQTLLSYLDETRVHLEFKMPLSEIIFDFFDKLKQVSSGHATLDYEELEEFVKSDVVKVAIYLNGQPAEPLSVISHRSKAEYIGKLLTSKLKEVIPRQMFEIRVQASIGTKIIARETIKPFRKDVTAKCYGGDITRKRKLLDKQKEGKKKMKSIGNVELDQSAFLAVTKLTEPSSNSSSK